MFSKGVLQIGGEEDGRFAGTRAAGGDDDGGGGDDDDDCVGGDDDYSQFFQTLGVKKKRILVLAMLGLQLLQSAESL